MTKAERTELLTQQLVRVVNNNSGALQAFQNGMNNINILTRRHVILLSLIQEKLGITDEDIRAESEKLVKQTEENKRAREEAEAANADKDKDSAEGSDVQSEEAGTDEDRNGHEQPGVLDAESSGVDPASSETVEGDGDRGSVCSSEPDESDPTLGPSESIFDLDGQARREAQK